MKRMVDKFRQIGAWLLICTMITCCLSSCGTPKIKSLTLKVSITDLDINKTQDVILSSDPKDANLEEVIIKSSNDSIAKVEGTTLKTFKEGVVNLYAETKDGKIKSNQVTINVIDKKKKAESEAQIQAQKQKEKDQASAIKIDEAIEAIGDVTLESSSVIEKVRKQYNALSADAKNMVTKIEVLTAAEAKYKSLKDEADQAAAQQAEAERKAQEEAAAKQAETERQAQKQAEAKSNGGGSGNADNFNKYNNPDQQNTQSYVLNTNTKKFHKPTCGEVKKIKSSNYSTIESRDQAINQGYVPCKKCNP